MNADDVARYLQDNPEFFEDYADVLARVSIPHPHGDNAISITERQVLALREKVGQLESKLRELIRFGEENDAISEKVHRLATALAGASNFVAVRRALLTHLSEDFAVPHAAFRLWRPQVLAEDEEFTEVSEQTRNFAAEMSHPFCGANAGFEAVAWFGEAGEEVRSVALVALRRETETVGLLALGSEDAQRFYAEMGTYYLRYIGELASAALLRTLV